MVYFNRYIIQFLILLTVFVWLIVFQVPDNNLHIISCNVGQGDAILVIQKNIQILTDGGPNKSVLDCLSRYMPFWDRKIELVILTHPDSDHATGLIDVIKRYNVETLLQNNLNTSTQVYKVLQNDVGSKGIKVINPSNDMSIRLDMIYLDILHPDKDFKSSKTNDYSIVYLLKYNDFKAIFTGDISPEIGERIAMSNKIGKVDYIKIPHHGSRNGLTENLLKALEPKIAVISAGKENRYGHPHKEIIDMLNKYEVKIFRTDEIGDVQVETDGKKVWIKN